MKRIQKYADDILIVLGCAIILVGVYQFNPALAWIVAGLECVALGVLIGIGAE